MAIVYDNFAAFFGPAQPAGVPRGGEMHLFVCASVYLFNVSADSSLKWLGVLSIVAVFRRVS